jgi:hypothetical protein
MYLIVPSQVKIREKRVTANMIVYYKWVRPNLDPESKYTCPPQENSEGRKEGASNRHNVAAYSFQR